MGATNVVETKSTRRRPDPACICLQSWIEVAGKAQSERGRKRARHSERRSSKRAAKGPRNANIRAYSTEGKKKHIRTEEKKRGNGRGWTNLSGGGWDRICRMAAKSLAAVLFSGLLHGGRQRAYDKNDLRK
jgi:hypothetical protein